MLLFTNDITFPNPKEYQKGINVGITGGIGAGKSIVSRILRCNGYKVYDCDMEAKLLMTHDSKLKQELRENIGEEVYLKNGSLNKKYLSEMIFKNNHVRKIVNGFVHQAVREDILNKCKTGLHFIESAIPTSGGLVPILDKIWIVEAPLEVRIERTIKRDAITVTEVRNRITTQKEEISTIPNGRKFYIHNDDTDSIINQIIILLEKLKEE